MKPTVALVLGSGSARGLAHIGVIDELERQGYNISSVSGTSIGALIGGFYSMGRLKDYADWVCTLTRRDIIGLMDLTLSSNGLIKAERVMRKLESFIPDTDIEKMRIPFAAVATDIVNREEIVITSGSFYKAARASIAIPTIITPVSDHNRILVDGGLLNPIPLNRVTRTPGDILVAVSLYDSRHIREENKNNKDNTDDDQDNHSFLSEFINSHEKIQQFAERIREFIPGGDKQNHGYSTLIRQSTSIMLERISELSLKMFKPDILVNIPVDSAGTFEFHKAVQLIKAGRKAAYEKIIEYRKKHPSGQRV